VELLTQDLTVHQLGRSAPFTVGALAMLDVVNDGNRLFTLVSSYRVAVEADGQWWRSDYFLLEPEKPFRPLDELVCGQVAGNDIYQAATLGFEDTMQGAAALLNGQRGDTLLVGLEWDFSIPLEAIAEAEPDPLAPSRVTYAAKVLTVEPASLLTVADALRMMCDIVKHRQNVKLLADEPVQRRRKLPLYR
jgi:hypothetical protein